MSAIKSEDPITYGRAGASSEDDEIITKAMAILAARLREPGEAINSPSTLRQFLTLSISERERECFGVLALDNRHRVIEIAELFHGTIDGASVYPREVVKFALSRNAAAVIFYHNHPSGNPEPSSADKAITNKLRDALALIDVRVLDHVIIGGMDSCSFAERGWL